MDRENESNQFDGTTLTEEEQKLVDAGLEVDDEAPAALAAKPGAETTTTTDTAPVEEPAGPVALAIPDAPTPPKDFEAEAERLEKEYDEGNLTILELNKAMRKLTLEEVEFKNQHADWERTKASIEAQNTANVQSHEQKVQTSWEQAAVAFEADHKDFLANPLRHKVMQNAISHVEAEIAKTGERLTDAQVLEKAYGIAVDYTGYQAPAEHKLTREQVAEAAKDRGGKTIQTLGDMPAARVESIRGDATFEGLDALPIDELEVAFANMSKAQQEKYLASAPGATATGRE